MTASHEPSSGTPRSTPQSPVDVLQARLAQNMVEKITEAHLADPGSAPPRGVRAGDFVAIRPRHVMTHDNTAAVLPKFEGIGASRIADPSQPVFAIDHDIQNVGQKNLDKYARIAAFAAGMGVRAYRAGDGIGHQLMIERGHVTPGAFVVASDSHSNTYGALGAIGTPVVRTDAAAIWATGEFWWQVPRTVRVELRGALRLGVTGKDVILTLCGLYDQGEALNAALEFCGEGLATLDVDARLSIANMSTEWGALCAWFPVDAIALDWLQRRAAILADQATAERPAPFTAADVDRWRRTPPAPDVGAHYAADLSLDLSAVEPQIAGPDFVSATRPLSEVATERIPIHKAYLVSCVNARQSDLRAAAEVLRGNRIASGVDLYVAAASAEIQADAEREGTWQALLDAGATPLPPGCGPCIGLGAGLLEPGQNAISATNRNFKGRMGSRDAKCYLGSPAAVARSALAGYIDGPRLPASATPLRRHIEIRGDAEVNGESAVEILAGFPAEIRGRLVYLPQDDLNTDGIYGKDYTYREDMTPAEMAAVVMANYDPDFATRVQSGDVLVAGWNFGTGSSREQAVTALLHKGIPLVIAASYSQTYLRNAFNNGMPCVECADLQSYLRECFASDVVGGAKTLIADDEIHIDFRCGQITWRGETFLFPTLGAVPQALVVAGGVENLVRQRLAQTATTGS